MNSLLDATPNQPGGNGVYAANVTAPVVGGNVQLFYVAFAGNGIEFAHTAVLPVLITAGP